MTADKIQPAFLRSKHQIGHTAGHVSGPAGRTLAPQHSGTETTRVHCLRTGDQTALWAPQDLRISPAAGCHLCHRSPLSQGRVKLLSLSPAGRQSLEPGPRANSPGSRIFLDVDISKRCLPFPACKPSRILFSFQKGLHNSQRDRERDLQLQVF